TSKRCSPSWAGPRSPYRLRPARLPNLWVVARITAASSGTSYVSQTTVAACLAGSGMSSTRSRAAKRQTRCLPSCLPSASARGHTCLLVNAVTPTRRTFRWPSACPTMRFSACDLPAPAAARSRLRSQAADPSGVASSTPRAAVVAASLPAAASSGWVAAPGRIVTDGGRKPGLWLVEVIDGQLLRDAGIHDRDGVAGRGALGHRVELVLVEHRRPHLRVQLAVLPPSSQLVRPLGLGRL